MTEEKKKQLFPYFAYVYSQQLNPAKYGEVGSFDEWSKLLDENPEDLDKISQAASGLTDEDWVNLEQEFSQSSQPVKAKNGAKLDNLKKLKSFKKKSETKKCACGCDLISVKEAGGKITTKCACGCKAKKESGGVLTKKPKFMEKDDSVAVRQKMNSYKVKKFKD